MAETEQFEIVMQILKRFHASGILGRLILIGSWCLHFYRYGVQTLEGLSTSRTTDIDFLVPRPFHFKPEIDVPAMLEELDFAPTYHGMSGLAVFDRPELRLEFLVPDIGKGASGPVAINGLHVKAQAIRHLNFLTAQTVTIIYHGLKVQVPDPAVFALHKLLISSKRTKKDKREKDLSMAVGILELLFKDPKEEKRVKKVLSGLPLKWRKIILLVSARHFPALNSDNLR